MAPQCERCNKPLKGKGGGLIERLRLRNYEGYECQGCGAILCRECFRKRRRELAGSAYDACPVCGGILEHR